MLEDYIIDDRLRYESHYLKVAQTEIEIGSVAGAALLSALIVDTEEGVRRGIAIDSDAERMAWIKQYEREVRRNEWGLIDTEVELLNEAYIGLATSEVEWADICPNVRLLDLALQLVTTYMRYLTVETFGNHIWEYQTWEEPFAQWLLNAAQTETLRQHFLHTDWTNPVQVNALYEAIQREDEPPTFIFEGEEAEEVSITTVRSRSTVVRSRAIKPVQSAEVFGAATSGTDSRCKGRISSTITSPAVCPVMSSCLDDV